MLTTDLSFYDSELYICSRLEDVSHNYMKAIKKHRDSSLKGKMNSYVFKAKDAQEQVDDLRREVNRIIQRFMVGRPCRSLSRQGTNAL